MTKNHLQSIFLVYKCHMKQSAIKIYCLEADMSPLGQDLIPTVLLRDNIK